MLNWLIKNTLKLTWLDINSKAVNWFLGNKLRGVGQVLDLKIDFKAKTAQCKIKLNGESEPIQISVDGLELTHPDNKYYINIKSATVSREWLQALANQFAVGKKIAISKDIYNTINEMFEK
jgi:hypothetical protein